MRFTIPEQKKLTRAVTIAILRGNMDAMSHAYNTVCSRYFWIARLDWLCSVGGGANGNPQGLLIVNAFCNFPRQLTFPGDALVRHDV